MNSQFKQKNHKNVLFGMKKTDVIVRLLCALCVFTLCLVSFSGCANVAPSEEVDLLKTQLSNSIQENETLKKNNQAAQMEIDAIKGKNQVAQEEIDSLKLSNQTAQAEIDSLKSSNQAAQAEIDSLKSSNQAAQAEIDSLKSSNQAAKTEIDSLKSSNQAAKTEIDSLKSSNQAAQVEIDSLKSSNQAAQAEIEALKEQIQELLDSTDPVVPDNKIKIYIDQGHNPTSYHNAGATGNGLYEQDLTFSIGCLLAELLENDGRFEVQLSRPTEYTVLGTDNNTSLEARVSGAKSFGADYFISLHTNAFETDSANGIEVLVAEEGSESYDFGNSLLDGMIISTNLKNRGMKLRPDLYVLKNATMPAALLEMGFITNVNDAALLSQSPELFAQGIYGGILSYFELPPCDTSAN